MTWFKHYPLGHSISGSPHSVCVSLPTMADVIAYEEKRADTLAAFTSGYPRFFRNPLIARLAEHWSAEGRMAEGHPLLATKAAAEDLCHFAGIPARHIREQDGAWSVNLPVSGTIALEAAAFLRHTGSGLSSREAEAILHRITGHPVYPEARADGSAADCLRVIREQLHNVYGTAHLDDIRIFRSGMNAFYSGFRALQAIQADRGKDIWIQLGWLYVDTGRILERFAEQSARTIQVYNVLDFDDLREVLKECGRRVAGIVTEVPTNPLVQTPDLEALRSLADRYNAALILDPTLVSPHNVNILSFSDLHINSLTKYAASEADVMMGALALNPRSAFYNELRDTADAFGTSASPEDLARMAAQIVHYEDNVRVINRNATEVAAFMESRPFVHGLHWARTQPSAYNFQWLQHGDCGPGGILTFSVGRPLAEFYDRCRFVKSPSFGARFTMMCPFMYLAHYDWVTDPQRSAQLRQLGLDPDLIRLSIGLEPADAIIAELDRCL